MSVDALLTQHSGYEMHMLAALQGVKRLSGHCQSAGHDLKLVCVSMLLLTTMQQHTGVIQDLV
jgi:hypothetical protein